jgi:hypothetical protein
LHTHSAQPVTTVERPEKNGNTARVLYLGLGGPSVEGGVAQVLRELQVQPLPAVEWLGLRAGRKGGRGEERRDMVNKRIGSGRNDKGWKHDNAHNAAR